MARIDADAPHEVMLVVDASNGQYALNQARQFIQAVPLTGLSLTPGGPYDARANQSLSWPD